MHAKGLIPLTRVLGTKVYRGHNHTSNSLFVCCFSCITGHLISEYAISKIGKMVIVWLYSTPGKDCYIILLFDNFTPVCEWYI